TKAVDPMNPGRPRAFLARRIEGDAGALGDGARNIPFALQEKRITGRRLDRRIPENRRHAKQVDLRMAVQKEEGHGIVDARVRVVNDFVHDYSLLFSRRVTGRPAKCLTILADAISAISDAILSDLVTAYGKSDRNRELSADFGNRRGRKCGFQFWN